MYYIMSCKPYKNIHKYILHSVYINISKFPRCVYFYNDDDDDDF